MNSLSRLSFAWRLWFSGINHVPGSFSGRDTSPLLRLAAGNHPLARGAVPEISPEVVFFQSIMVGANMTPFHQCKVLQWRGTVTAPNKQAGLRQQLNDMRSNLLLLNVFILVNKKLRNVVFILLYTDIVFLAESRLKCCNLF